MRRTIALAIALLLPVITLLPGTSNVTGQGETVPGSKFFRSENPVPNQYLVIFRDNLESADQLVTANALTQQHGGQVLQCPYEAGVNGFSVQTSEAIALALSEDARVQSVQEIPASGFPRSGSGNNVALATNGAQAFASSTLNSSFPVSTIINGDRRGAGWGAGTGGWHDASASTFPDYLEIHFSGEKRINQIDLFTLQDAFTNPAEPTQEMTFSQYGVTSFRLNYWDATSNQWVTLKQIDGNSNVWRTVKFPTVLTPKLSIMILNGATNYSRVVEIEAWEAPPSNNVALASNGGQAFASSALSSAFPASAIVNGDNIGSGWAAGTGGWHDATGNTFPDYLEIHFNGEKRINEVDLFTLQDNFNEPVEPTADLTFSQYGVTAFRVSYWNSATSQWVTLDEVHNNNLVWRKLEFAAVTTTKLSIAILNGATNHSRVVEIEAWEAPTPKENEQAPVIEEEVPEPPDQDPTSEEIIFNPNPLPGGDFPDAAPAEAAPPAENLKLTTDKRYFLYRNKAIALVGNSSSYVPHIARNRTKNQRYDPVFENCTFDEVGGFLPDGVTKKRKFHVCINQMVTDGLNHMQIWVALNHSLGMLRKESPNPVANTPGTPFTDEQPFKRLNGKWDLKLVTTESDLKKAFNPNFFANLKEVVAYAQTKDVIVGVVLFDPWSGWDDASNTPSISPWWSTNNTLGKGFFDPRHFAKSDSFNINTIGNQNVAIDSNPDNKTLRSVQVSLLKRTVLELKDFKNIYWVIGNEVDLGGAAVGQPLITWLRYMANTLRAYEPLANRHLIAVNVSTNPAAIGGHPADRTDPANPSTTKVITAMTKEANVDIITSHYVQLQGAVGPNGGKVFEIDRYSGIKLLREFNKYTNGGANIDNTKLWGFTEDRPTGVRNWNPPWAADAVFTSYDPTWAAAAVRVEAWEFLLNGGGLFDHLSYRWGNLTNVNPPFAWNKGNEPQALAARAQLGYLNKFMRTLHLDGMKRMTAGENISWIKPAPAYAPFSYWSAMSRARTGSGAATKFETFLFYFHRSTLVNTGAKYEPHNINNNLTTTTINVTQMPFTGCYQADWYAPSGETIDNKVGLVGGALAVVQTGKFYSANAASSRPLQSPKYKQDVLLKITWFGAGQCPP